MKLKNAIYTIIIGAFLYCAALAQDGTPDSTAAPVREIYSPSLFGILVKLVISLGLIIGLIYLSTYLMKRFNSRVTGGGGFGETIKVMGRTYLSPKQSLYLVKIGGKYAVIGATDQSVSKIADLEEDEIAKSDSHKTSSEYGESRGKFAEIFKGLIKR